MEKYSGCWRSFSIATRNNHSYGVLSRTYFPDFAYLKKINIHQKKAQVVLCLFNCGAAYSGLTERNGLRIGFNGCQFFVIFTECIVGLISLYRSGCSDAKLKTPSKCLIETHRDHQVRNSYSPTQSSSNCTDV